MDDIDKLFNRIAYLIECISTDGFVNDEVRKEAKEIMTQIDKMLGKDG